MGNIRALIGLTKRNMLVYLKSKSTVFFSMLAPLIVLCLYLFFLKNNYVSSITNSLVDFKAVIDDKMINGFVNSWLLAGVLGTGCVTVSLNNISQMVHDKETKINYDFNSSPVNSKIVFSSYGLAAFINTSLINAIVLTIGLIIFAIQGTFTYTFLEVINLYFLVFLGSLSSVLLMMIIVSLFNNTSAVGAFNGIVSAGIGFVIGAYIPIGSFSSTIQNVSNLLPGSHVACLFRNVLMLPALDKMNVAIAGADGGEFAASMENTFGFNLTFFTKELPVYGMYIYILVFIILSLLINFFVYKKTSVRK